MASIIAGRALARTWATTCLRPHVLHYSARNGASRIAARSFSVGLRALEKKYTEDHEWVELSQDKKTGTIGISEYAADALGEVVYVELPSADLAIKAGDAIGAVESVKSASDIMSPISGTVIEGNQVLEDKPGTINKSPESEAWIAKIAVSDPTETDALMDAEGYKRFTEDVNEKH